MPRDIKDVLESFGQIWFIISVKRSIHTELKSEIQIVLSLCVAKIWQFEENIFYIGAYRESDCDVTIRGIKSHISQKISYVE